jgi:hypothetical protein
MTRHRIPAEVLLGFSTFSWTRWLIRKLFRIEQRN